MKEELLRSVCKEIGIESSLPKDELRYSLKDEVMLLGWEGFLLNQRTEVLKDIHKGWDVVDVSLATKEQMVEMYIHTYTTTYTLSHTHEREREREQRKGFNSMPYLLILHFIIQSGDFCF